MPDSPITTILTDSRLAKRSDNLNIEVHSQISPTGEKVYTAKVLSTPVTATGRTEEIAVEAARQEWREKCWTLGPQAAGQRTF